MTIGEKLKQARIAAGITHRDLARRLNISQKYIESWETDQIELSDLALRKLEKLFKVRR